jgi:4a-hydroxytetrahydrobiopterin dehydratase
MGTIGEAEARERLNGLPGWTLSGKAIQRQFIFAGFADALAFVTRLGFDAEAADHHPDIVVNYRRVTLSYSTHSAGGLTEKDFAGAAAADTLAQRFGAG